jgi:DNA adenine methylase
MISEKVKCDWIITYDDAPEISNIYSRHRIRRYDLNYSVSEKKRASEIIIFKDDIIVPTQEELLAVGCDINLR